MNIKVLAGILYSAYCQSTDFKSAVTGAPLPTWEEMLDNPERANVVKAWEASASAAQKAQSSGKTLRAKMVCLQNEKSESGESVLVGLNVVTGGPGAEENKSFSKLTPSGGANLVITNPDALDFFEQGQEYYLTFEGS